MARLTPNGTREYYERNAAVYDAKTGFGRPGGQEFNFARYYEPFLERMVPAKGRVLELGCGTGFYTRWMVKRGLQVLAMDISPRMIARSREHDPDGAEYFVGNCEDPASALGEAVDGGFDAIVGINTFSYYENKLGALRHYRELLRPGGRLIMLDMNGTSLTQQLAYMFDYRGARRFAENVDQSTPARLSELLQETGFQVEYMKRASFMPNEVGALGVALLSPAERLFSRVPFAERFAFRIFWTASRLADSG